MYPSEHFDIFHDGVPEAQLRDVAREAEAAFTHLSAALKYEVPRRVPLILVRRDSDLADDAAQARDLVARDVAPGQQRLVISTESLGGRPGIIVHELTHQFAFEIVPDTSRVAPFLIEGLAEHQRGTWAADDLRRTRAAAATGVVPAVASLATTDAHWAHALFDFVAAQYGAEGVRRLLFALRAHEVVERAVPVAYGLTLDEFDRAFRAYVTTRFGQP